jgi:hypothetical protein
MVSTELPQVPELYRLDNTRVIGYKIEELRARTEKKTDDRKEREP